MPQPAGKDGVRRPTPAAGNGIFYLETKPRGRVSVEHVHGGPVWWAWFSVGGRGNVCVRGWSGIPVLCGVGAGGEGGRDVGLRDVSGLWVPNPDTGVRGVPGMKFRISCSLDYEIALGPSVS